MTAISRLPRPVLSSYSWQQQGACRGEDVEKFFTDDEDRGQRRRKAREAAAKAICDRCPVVEACLQHAMTVPEPHGIWGGTTASDRAGMTWGVAG